MLEEDLAKVRGNGTIEKIKTSLKQRGVAETDIVFLSNKAFALAA